MTVLYVFAGYCKSSDVSCTRRPIASCRGCQRSATSCPLERIARLRGGQRSLGVFGAPLACKRTTAFSRAVSEGCALFCEFRFAVVSDAPPI